ncbi:hypothetical protein DFH29DRAFT_1010014 [Suillus ampliporus]|nr:hypothetical protein DFH29DRAFT_1010014 [Suillus ampliporus]
MYPGAIIAWYLPDALTDATQKEIWAASDLLAPMLEESIKVDGNWRTNQRWFKPSSEDDVLTPGCINVSPGVVSTGARESVGSSGICIIEGSIVREDPQSHCKASSHCNSGTQGDAS